MRSTYLSLHYHIVFATAHRAPVIASPWRARLHEYLGGTIKGLGGHVRAVGGVADHVHVFADLKATHVLADVVRELKKSSSRWVHSEIGIRDFAWQQGYSAFTVGATGREAVTRYIVNQEQHHAAKAFRMELLTMLNTANIAHDPADLD